MITSKVKLWVFMMLLAGCNAGPVIRPENAETFVDDFISGRVKMTYANMFALPSPWYTDRVFNYWRQKQWSLLAREVVENGFDIDINWFLLGESARNSGFYKAAEIYYNRALEDAISNNNIVRCRFYDIKVPSDYPTCSHFVFPRDILIGQKELDKMIKMKNKPKR